LRAAHHAGNVAGVEVCAKHDHAVALKLLFRGFGALVPLFRTVEHVAVFEDADEGRVIFLPHPRNREQTPLWIEHPRLGDRADIAVLPLTAVDDVEIFPYELADGPTLVYRPSDAVSVVGFPFGMQAGGSLAVWTTGFVASEPQVDYNGLPIFLVDCRTRNGQSGSAVIVHRNGGWVTMEDGQPRLLQTPATRFVGIYSGRINEESDLGMVWKAQAVAEAVNSV
jgi:hypothetical protein